MKKISEETRELILNTQYRQKLQGEHHVRVGELLVQGGFMDEATRDNLLIQQESWNRTPSVSAHDIPHPTSTLLPAVVAFLAIVVVVIAAVRFPHHLELTIVVVGFITYVLETLRQYKGGRPLSLSLQRAVFPLMMLVLISLVVFAAISIFTIKHDHFGSHPPEEEIERIRRITFAFVSLSAAISILLIYSLWKFHSLRFSQSRLGAVKDILIRVESILRDNSKTLDERQSEAIKKVLKGLRNAIRLSPTDRIMRLVSVFRPSFNQTRVLYYVKDSSVEHFQLYDAAYPERVLDEVRAAFEWIKENHQPVLLDEEEFENQKELARRISPQDWKNSYLKLPERHKYISVCGWIYDKKEILISADASKCLALDDSFLKKMEEEGFDADILQWVEVGSFVGCRIISKGGAPTGVLLVVKNIRKGFPPEDLEVVIAVSQILGRILQAT